MPQAWTATKEKRYLDQAVRAVDYLLLFQGVWSPPYLTVKGFGSIGIGNGHTGWNDARAGIFAPGIADFYELTGNIEYLQRSVAAMRAPLALMYVPENEAAHFAIIKEYFQQAANNAKISVAVSGRCRELRDSCA